MFKEEFLHYIWQFKLWNNTPLITSEGEEIEVINTGIHNTDSGPDFFNAQLKIGKNKWAGNVEIHIQSSDWFAHQHQNDDSYNNVILHVVYHHNKAIKDKNGNLIPTLELENLIDEKLIANYNNLINSKDWIPCQNQIAKVDLFVLENWLNRLAIERLERKSAEIQQTLQLNKNDWETTFYQYLFKYFGLKVNALPFELLAKNTKLKIPEAHPNLESIEALYFGQAGFLKEEFEDEYFQGLKKEYRFLQAKYQLQPLEKSVWKFLRLRPSNFPTIRISQLANLLHKNTRLFSKVLEAKKLSELQKLFIANTSVYWDKHYIFEKESEPTKPKKVGVTTINSLIINVVVPFLFIYAKEHQQETTKQKALNYLEQLPSEANSIIKKWAELDVKSNNSLQSQALLELKNNYCSQKKCLNCSIGNKLLKK